MAPPRSVVAASLAMGQGVVLMRDTAYIIKIKDRYFHGFDENGRLDSRPCFAGATLVGGFTRRPGPTDEIIEKLRRKGYNPKLIEIVQGEEVAPF